MSIERMDNVLIVVSDIDLAKDFFIELGMELEGETIVSGEWVDKVVGLEGVQNKIAMMRTPDGNSKIELSEFISPTIENIEIDTAPVNTLGIRRIMFAVENIDEILSRLESFGTELVGEIAQYEEIYRLCYIRGPDGIIIGLAEQLSNK